MDGWGTRSASGFGPGGPDLLADLDRGDQIHRDTRSSNVLMGLYLYLVVFLAVQYVVGVILAKHAFGRNRSPKKRSDLSHLWASQIEKFKLRQRFIVSVRIYFLSQCR